MIKRTSDHKFVEKAQEKINTILAGCSLLRVEIGKLIKSREYDTDMVGAIRRLDQLEGVVNHILRPATVACLTGLEKGGKDFTIRWDAARRVLSWLCVLAVKEEWVAQAEKSPELFLEFEVDTALGIQVLSARYRQRPIYLPTQMNGSSDIANPDSFAVPPLFVGYNLHAEVDRLMLDIWRRIFPADSRVSLSTTDVKSLNAALGVREINKTEHHYLPFSSGQSTPLNDRLFLDHLLGKLSNLVIIRVATPSGSCPLLASSENTLLNTVISFLEIPDKLDKCP